MGEQGRVRGPVLLRAQVQGTRDLDTVEVFCGDRLIHVASPQAPQATVEVVDRDAPWTGAGAGGEVAYWVRATQRAERNGSRPHQGIAYSSPVWVAAG